MNPPVTSNDVGLYVHFPYCEHKCPYCDFNSHVMAFDGTAYADAVLREIEDRAFAPEISTLFFGGGTPSLWAPEQVERVIRFARERYALPRDAEITLEANPGTVHERLFENFVAAGVNRFSIGVQSFSDPELRALGRIHDAAAGVRAVESALAAGARVSLDLIYAQPEQTWPAVRANLDRALALGVDHISAYTLTVEPDTHLGRRYASGDFTPLDDDAQAEQIEHVNQFLAAAGFIHYEVSNYARGGHFARHNTLYWVGGPYLGVGAGAASYQPAPGLARSTRRENQKAPALYLATALAGEHRARVEYALDRRETLAERLFVGLRTIWGVDVTALAEEAAAPALGPGLAAFLEPLVSEGLLTHEAGRFAPTERGFLFADLIARRVFTGELPSEDAHEA